jgi:hypothetical protein
VHLDDVIRQPLGETRGARHLVRPGRHHDLPRDQFAVPGGNAELAVALLAQPGHRHVLPQREPVRVHVIVEVGGDLVPHHEPVRVVAAVREPGELALPIWRDETEAVPAALPPLPARFSFVHNDVFHPPAQQLMAHREAGLAAADHRHSGLSGELHAQQ